MPTYHAYQDGYSVLPGLRKCTVRDAFQTAQLDQAHHQRCLRAKRDAASTQSVEFRCNFPAQLEAELSKFITQHSPVTLPQTDTLAEIAMQMQEDIIVHCLDEQTDWMAYGHVCLPSGWLPEEKIGRTFEEIHLPVAGMDLSQSRRLTETIIHHGPFQRYVWSVVHEDTLNFHPSRPKQRFIQLRRCCS